MTRRHRWPRTRQRFSCSTGKAGTSDSSDTRRTRKRSLRSCRRSAEAMTNTVNPGIYPLVRAPDGRFYSDPTKAPLEGEIRWSQSTIDATGVIDSGVNVLLDTHANPGATLYNSGRIRVSNAYNDVSITLGMYHGEIGGEFIVGTDAEPFEGRLLITVNGAAPSSPATNTGHEKGAMLHGHKWHVRSKYQTPFVCVGANASAGSTVITLRDPPENWKAGDDLAL